MLNPNEDMILKFTAAKFLRDLLTDNQQVFEKLLEIFDTDQFMQFGLFTNFDKNNN